jgi:NADH:ubiquinone oxidoreductase subunit E
MLEVVTQKMLQILAEPLKCLFFIPESRHTYVASQLLFVFHNAHLVVTGQPNLHHHLVQANHCFFCRKLCCDLHCSDLKAYLLNPRR